MNNLLQQLQLDTDGVNSGCYHGSWVAPGSNIIESFSPASGQLIGKVASSSDVDYEDTMAAATTLAKAWAKVPAPERGQAVRLATEALRANKDALGSLVSLEMGKIKPEGDGEVQEMIDIGEFAVGQSRMLYGNTMHSERPSHRMYEQWHPLGVVGIISAFNFPVAVWAWNAFIAAVCGNVSVWKPSPKTPLVAVATMKICNQALVDGGFPPIFMLFNDSGNELAQKFVDDRRVGLMSFTGSCAIGNQVGERVAARMGKSLLELGGNNAMIVDPTADLKLAVPAIVFGAVGTAGQRCTTTRRVIVHESIIDELSETLTGAYGQVRIGDPLDENTLMGPLIDQDSVARFSSAVATIKEQGGTILSGGEVIEGDGNFVQPTLVRAGADMPMVSTETFAPICYLLPYSTLDEAIDIQNSVPQGLSSALFTTDLRAAEQFLSSVGSDCGIANINIGTSGAEIGGAFGGEKETGGGRESGSDAWKAYMRRQTNTINYGNDLPLAQGIKFDL
ncbi:MAG: aldehyde dehydrogenase family protein [Lysobacterales bacterium]